MKQGFEFAPEQKFTTPQDELSFLRERLEHLEQNIEKGTHSPEKQSAPEEIIHQYIKHEPEKVLEKGHAMLKPEVDSIVLDLEPEEHDAKMAELLGILQTKGVRNALSIVEAMNDPHVEDDFHRFLSEYLKAGYHVKGFKEKDPLWRPLHMVLFEVNLPNFTKQESGDREKTLKEMISSMEQLYAGFAALTEDTKKKQNHFTLELAVEAEHEHATFYLAVPGDKKEIFQKQLLSVFPQARLIENKNDYNIFPEGGATVASEATFERANAYPLKVHEAFDYDPLNIILSAFSKLQKEGEGASLQLAVRSRGDMYAKNFKKSLDELKKGKPVKEALNQKTIGDHVGEGLKELIIGGKKKDDKPEEKQVDDIVVEQITKKIASPIVGVNIRLVTSAQTKQRAEEIIHDLETAFHQFEEAQGNALEFKRAKDRHIKRFVRDFTFRLFNPSKAIPLSLTELTTLYHLPATDVESSRELKRSKASTAPPPLDMPTEGTLLGINRYGSTETPVYFTKEDRVRHFYVIGQTGTGKTSILKNIIVQDIKNGDGVCMIDPHGSDIQDILAQIPPERFDDVIYFDPSYTPRPMGLNMLEYDQAYPEQKTFVVNELFSIFQKLYGANPESMGPMFEQYFRNATMLVIEDPETGNTLLDVSRVMADAEYRKLKLSRCSNPIVVQFWREVAEKAGGDAALQNMVPYITSKFDVFLANDVMRPIVAQPKSAFNFRKIMDEQKILLVNLAKGRLGDINANLLGLIIVGKILMAALSRVDVLGRDTKPADFYLYIDEFQNVTTDSIATILSEARKYRLSLNIAHQFIAQLEDKIKDAVFGNVGSICAFRVGAEDAEFLENQFEPVFSANDLMNVDNFNAFAKMLINGKPERPFNIATIPPVDGDPKIAEQLKEYSYQRYGRPREDIEAEVMKKYHKEPPAPAPPRPSSRFTPPQQGV